MKFVILVCSFVVLLACNEVQCGAGRPQLTGNCKLEDLPESERTSCYKIHCTKNEKGEMQYNALLCPVAQCYDQPARWTEPDITKEYPGCCPNLICGEKA